MKPKNDLTASYLRSLFHYDEATGIFTRLTARGGRPVGSIAGTRRDDGYIVIGIDYADYLGHRLAWLYVKGYWPSEYLDHRDEVRHHNKFLNLRETTQSQNIANARMFSHNTSGYRGVSLRGDTNRWTAHIKKNGKRRCLGCFDSKELAHAAYSSAAIELFGEFARPA